MALGPTPLPRGEIVTKLLVSGLSKSPIVPLAGPRRGAECGSVSPNLARIAIQCGLKAALEIFVPQSCAVALPSRAQKVLCRIIGRCCAIHSRLPCDCPRRWRWTRFLGRRRGRRPARTARIPRGAAHWKKREESAAARHADSRPRQRGGGGVRRTSPSRPTRPPDHIP